MKLYNALFFIVLAFWLMSCEKDKKPVDNTPGELTGFWINPQYGDSIVIYERAGGFNDGHGFHFLDEGSLVEHKNAGFCGTPPITYADFDGTYSLNDSTLIVNAEYWGGVTPTTWKLISINPTILTIKMIQVVNGD